MKKFSRLDYAYAVGRIRVMERSLIQKAIFLEALETADFASALKVVYEAGRYPEDLIKAGNPAELDAVLEAESRTLDQEMADLIPETDVLNAFLRRDEPEVALHAARRSGYPFLVDYLRHRIDLGNIKLLVRAKYSGRSSDFLKARLLPGGRIEPETLVGIFSLPLGEIGQGLRASAYFDILTHGADALEERETFVVLEKEMENFLMAYLRGARRFTFGPEPVFAYAEAKRKEHRLIRLIGVGKFLLLPADRLKERVSETYV